MAYLVPAVWTLLTHVCCASGNPQLIRRYHWMEGLLSVDRFPLLFGGFLPFFFFLFL
ncbi:uncharacterized protein BDW43DRAFT_295550 [Aspergillus alliaceus]|uniref:uncharacterized protein n=1 Tax=Petromyces alliaceus TaxID=209559 RepID=UPI0012A56992|nr:uncharacterized protein BDW43DRAFT_295550 [Aspergillus alliaceus]KAB8226857.1 hypothetical protein BDW43DRAFT_295550 [Aspergillus alliaceus]